MNLSWLRSSHSRLLASATTFSTRSPTFVPTSRAPPLTAPLPHEAAADAPTSHHHVVPDERRLLAAAARVDRRVSVRKKKRTKIAACPVVANLRDLPSDLYVDALSLFPSRAHVVCRSWNASSNASVLDARSSLISTLVTQSISNNLYNYAFVLPFRVSVPRSHTVHFAVPTTAQQGARESHTAASLRKA